MSLSWTVTNSSNPNKALNPQLSVKSCRDYSPTKQEIPHLTYEKVVVSIPKSNEILYKCFQIRITRLVMFKEEPIRTRILYRYLIITMALRFDIIVEEARIRIHQILGHLFFVMRILNVQKFLLNFITVM